MKEIILHKLNKIKDVAVATGMKGTVTIGFDGVPVKEFDEALASITEIYHIKHIFELTPYLECYVLLN